MSSAFHVHAVHKFVSEKSLMIHCKTASPISLPQGIFSSRHLTLFSELKRLFLFECPSVCLQLLCGTCDIWYWTTEKIFGYSHATSIQKFHSSDFQKYFKDGKNKSHWSSCVSGIRPANATDGKTKYKGNITSLCLSV
jgi:hypothetical protein